MANSIDRSDMPDVANSLQAKIHTSLDWVGMSAIHLPTRLLDGKNGEQYIGASVQAYVSLDDEDAKGIHMSRLFLLLEDVFAQESVSMASLKLITTKFLESHIGLSHRAFVKFDFDYSIKRPALKSQYSGWKSYPITVSAVLDANQKTFDVELSCEVPYSSTCPCSAALARQLIQEQFYKDFGDDGSVDIDKVSQWIRSDKGIMATPHSQRSIAQVKVKLDENSDDALPVTALIDAIEDVLKTPVQTAVKREDEQEFARLNGQNLMFCEDAARRIKSTLNAENTYTDFWLRVNHLESLHAHDAVSIVTKNIPGGFLPIP